MAAALLAGGCTAFQPYVSAPDDKSASAILSKPIGSERLDASIDYAIAQANAWRSAANLESGVQSAQFAAIIPASAVAAYYGITGDRGSSAIAALATGSAGLYAWSTLSQAKPRQQTYIAGTRALSCVIWNAAPLAMPDSEAREFAQALSDITLGDERDGQRIGGIGDVREKIDRLSQMIAGAQPIEADVARRLIQTAETTIDAATEFRTQGRRLRAEIDAGALRVAAQVALIEAEVNAQLAAVQPTPEAVFNLAHQFRSASSQLIDSAAPPSVPDPAAISSIPPEAAAALAASGIGSAISDLATATRILADSTSRLAAIIESRGDSLAAASDLKACMPAETSQAMTISPPDKEVKLACKQTYPLLLSGGSGQFHTMMSADAAGLASLRFAEGPFSARAPVVEVSCETRQSGQFTVYATDLISGGAATAIRFQVG